MKYCSSKLFGFTLAETLITLGVIGVVAALTLPSVINNYRNKQLQVAFKAAYSIFSQTVINMVEEDGAGLKKKYTKYDSASQSYVNANEFYDKFYKYSKLNVIGKCSYSGKIMNYNKTGEAYSSYTSYTIVGRETIDKLLSNGMCSYLYVNAGQINITVDVNGTRGPNMLGHDIFYFTIDENDVLKPRKMSNLYDEEELEDMDFSFVAGIPCSKNSKQRGNGTGCAYYALIDESPDDSTKGYWESLP